MHISHGGLQFGKIRYFDGQKKRSGLPDDVAAMVDQISENAIRLELINLSLTEARVLTIQAGNFGENRFDSVIISTEDGQVHKIDINNKWLTVDISPKAGAILEFRYSRYVSKPTYENPYSLRSEWEN